MKGNKYVRTVQGFPEPWCDYCRAFTTNPKQHDHATKTPITDNKRLLEIIRASL